jgi:hypothetical protein
MLIIHFVKNKFMKKRFAFILIFVSSLQVTYAQDDHMPVKGFNKNRVFIGTSINLGLSNNFFNIGLNPEIGYSLTDWLDAGVVGNLNYFTQSSTFTKDKNVNYGGGGFLRIWPINFLHLQIQPEYNWISSSRTFNNGAPSTSFTNNTASVLAGIGYGSRQVGSRFSHFTIMIDLLQQLNSPYRDQFGDPQPVFRAGFGVYLNSKR